MMNCIKSEESHLYRNPMTDECWHQTIAKIQSHLALLDHGTLQQLVQSIAAGIRWLDASMGRYCELTCPACDNPCCRGREVFFNQADLLYLVASGEEFLPGQTRAIPGEPCRYLTDTGCRLPRISRPYVCVWFLCDPQMALFQEEHAAFQRHFVDVLRSVRTSRLVLESLYESFFTNGKRE